jgi:hypothetical protein
MARHRLHTRGARILVTAGVHQGKTGTIKKANPMRHSVIFANGTKGLVLRSYCSFVEHPDSLPGKTNATVTLHRMSRLSSPTTDTEAQLIVHSVVAATDQTDHSSLDRDDYGSPINGVFSVASSSVESYHGTEVTSQVLVDLLARSIASMQLEDTQIDEWTHQLRRRVTHFRSGSH